VLSLPLPPLLLASLLLLLLLEPGQSEGKRAP
jgi:hypothetical protein